MPVLPGIGGAAVRLDLKKHQNLCTRGTLHAADARFLPEIEAQLVCAHLIVTSDKRSVQTGGIGHFKWVSASRPCKPLIIGAFSNYS